MDISASTRWARFLSAGLVTLALGGCGAEASGHQLRVDLVTDFVPGAEFDAVRVSIGRGDIRASFDHVVDPTRNYVRGVALGDLRVAASEQAIEVLLFQDGGLIVARQVSVTVSAAVTIATVVITRDCRGVMCPDSGDNPLFASCLGGQCADPRCTVETPEFCPRGTCFTPTDCDPHACAETTCVTGACLYDLDESRCDTGQRCDLELGCVDGEFDASSSDAGMPDVPMPDVPLFDSGPDIADVPAPDAGPPPGCSGLDDDTLFLYDFETASDLAAGLDGSLRDAAALTSGGSPCGGQMLSTLGPLESRFVVPDEASFRIAEGSLDFWARRPSIVTANSVGLLSRDEEGTNTAGHITLFFSEDQRLVLRAQVSGALGVMLCSAATLPAEEWVRIGINWGPGGLEFYLNGVRQMAGGTASLFSGREDPCSTSTIPFSIAATQNPFVLGASIQASAPDSDEPATYPGPGWRYDHFRLSRVRRDYANEL